MDAKNQSQLLERLAIYLDSAKKNGIPYDAYLQITHRCNGRCEMCDIWKQRKLLDSPFRKISDIIHALRDREFRWVTLWGGEPYLHADIVAIMEEVKKCGMKLQIITNATVFKEDSSDSNETLHATNQLVDNFVASVDAPNAETHDKIRGVQGFFGKTVRNLLALVDLNRNEGRGPNIEIDTTVTRHNIQLLIEVIRFSKLFGDILVDFDPAQLHGVGNNESRTVIEIPHQDIDSVFNDLIDIARNGAHITSPAKLELIRKYLKGEKICGSCYSLFKDLLIGHNGDVYFCWGSDKIIGNILDGDFEQKWHAAIASNVDCITGDTDRCKGCGFSHVRWPDSGFREVIEGINSLRKKYYEQFRI